VHRMRRLAGELSKLRKEVELPCAPIHGDYKLSNVGKLSDGSWATFDLDFVRVRERLYDIASSLNHVVQSGPDGVGQPAELLEPRRLLEAYERTAPEPLTRDEHRWLPGALALVPCTGPPPQDSWATTASTRPGAQWPPPRPGGRAGPNSRRRPAAALGDGDRFGQGSNGHPHAPCACTRPHRLSLTSSDPTAQPVTGRKSRF
jgi:Ser/Thr protein kinase RdoA (MazF antagonist)